jgi:hypothetical protein
LLYLAMILWGRQSTSGSSRHADLSGVIGAGSFSRQALPASGSPEPGGIQPAVMSRSNAR